MISVFGKSKDWKSQTIQNIWDQEKNKKETRHT
jgi:hypothetical protein